MLTALSISNYALIKNLQVDFSGGLTIITGETGAGKSILLGALGLVLGNRADSSTLKNNDKKCVIEAVFNIKALKLHPFFEAEDLDYEEETIVRREILPSGKSRAFVNDTPVTLSVLNALRKRLIDVHSQHTTIELSNTDHQYRIVDALAANERLLREYTLQWKHCKQLQRALAVFEQEQEISEQAYAYNSHLLEELEAANFQLGEQEALEQSVEKLANVEAIKLSLSESVHVATDENMGAQKMLHQMHAALQKIDRYAPEYQSFSERLESLKIELEDVVFELEKANEQVDLSEEQINATNARLQLLYTLQKKHGVGSIEELSALQEKLRAKVDGVENAAVFRDEKQAAIHAAEKNLNKLCLELSKRRKKILPALTQQLQEVLSKLGMEAASFQINLEECTDFSVHGKDALTFLFSANKGIPHQEMKKVASGGELSRIMLGVKLILSKYAQLPTVLFDEIDTGVSGEVSQKIANVMHEMSQYMQVIAITHLPQIAAKGAHHFKVYKETLAGVSTTFLKPLSAEERISEIAEILGGKSISASALEHAKVLLHTRTEVDN